MKKTQKITAVFLLTVLVAVPGCGKKEKSVQSPQSKAFQATSSHKVAGKAVSSQDEVDAAAAKARVLAYLKSGDFTSIYREASAGFKKVGKEQQFVELWQKKSQLIGAIKDIKEVGHKVNEDNSLVYTHHVQYEKIKSELRLTFGRSKSGKMELTGINQRDIK